MAKKGDTINISIGQGGLITTLLQLTIAYNAIATQGLMVKPFLVYKTPEGKIQKPVVLDILNRSNSKGSFSDYQGRTKTSG